MDGRSSVTMTAAIVCLWWRVVVVVVAAAADAKTELAGPNVCTIAMNYTEDPETNDIELKRIKTSYFCLYNMYLTCYTNNYKDTSSSNINISKPEVKRCCEGYEPTQNGTWCRPVCKLPCVRGTCVAPNVCKCEEHYGGPYCNVNTDCPSGKFGFGCMHTCQCKNDAFCDSLDGFCVCQQGYTGKFCETTCPPGFYGYNCTEECKCQNSATCNTKNGTCTCQPGYTGKYCEYPCSADLYGYNCQNKCKCQNGALCDLANGVCSCQPGYVGKYCEFPCSLGFYGYNCKQKCKCQNGETCNPVTGECSCPPEYVGKHCESLCPSGFFGHQCQYECRCQHWATCDPVTGECHCEPGWTGVNCTTACPLGTFGIDCNSTCKCSNEATCRTTDGVCLCEPGFHGPTCSESCPTNFYGEICLHKCECDLRTEICDPIRGCVCDTNRPNNKCTSALRLESDIELSITWLFEISVVFCFIVISTIFAAVMICYLCCYRRRLKRCRRVYKNGFELDKSSCTGTMNYAVGATNSAQTRGTSDRVFYVGKKTSYTNEIFYAGYSRSNCSSQDAREHIYLEIDENSLRQRPEDLYDHLDFLRPTGAWKPHYQKTLMLQEQGNCSSNTEENTA